jgi:hypothetical protein
MPSIIRVLPRWPRGRRWLPASPGGPGEIPGVILQGMGSDRLVVQGYDVGMVAGVATGIVVQGLGDTLLLTQGYRPDRNTVVLQGLDSIHLVSQGYRG